MSTMIPTASSTMKEQILDLLKNLSEPVEEPLWNVTNTVIDLVNSSSFKLTFDEPIENGRNGSRVRVCTTDLNSLCVERMNFTSIPNTTISKLCHNQPSCPVKMIEIQLTNFSVDTNPLAEGLSPLASSDIIVWDVIANGQRVSKLEENETVYLNFPLKLKNISEEQVHCAYLRGDNSSGARWNKKGMNLHSIGDDVNCSTDHLSAFTMAVLPTSGVSESNKKGLTYLTYVGCGLSLAGLLFSCVVYVVLYKDLEILTTARHLVHLNLLIALGLTQIVFLVGGSATHNKIACSAVAILVHYFSMAGFTWIFLEAVMLYLKLIAVYGGEFVRFKNFMLFGWGFPLPLVILSAGLKIEAYGTKEWCWLSSEDGFVWLFYAPVILITLVGIVTVLAVVRLLLKLPKSYTTQADGKKRVTAALRGVVILFPTLGLSWGFSVVALSNDSMVWKYLFTIFTSLQGFLVFLIHGVCNTEIRNAVGRKMGSNIFPASSHNDIPLH